jgi:hypothetical protein|tara:strand:+ start:11569 stop:11874 length:306 start_codon:yes stop_codon:yes gene_type:complete
MSKKTTANVSALILIISNLLDTIFTLKYIKFGPLDEANPIMNALLGGDGSLFAFFKVFFVTLFVFLLWNSKNNKIAYFSLIILSIFYLFLVIGWLMMIFLL